MHFTGKTRRHEIAGRLFYFVPSHRLSLSFASISRLEISILDAIRHNGLSIFILTVWLEIAASWVPVARTNQTGQPRALCCTLLSGMKQIIVKVDIESLY